MSRLGMCAHKINLERVPRLNYPELELIAAVTNIIADVTNGI